MIKNNASDLKKLLWIQRQLLNINRESEAIKMSDIDRHFLNSQLNKSLYRTLTALELATEINIDETADLEDSFKELEALIKSWCRELLASASDKDLTMRDILLQCLTNIYDIQDKFHQKRGDRKGRRSVYKEAKS